MDDLAYGAATIDDCKIQIQKILYTMNAGKMPLTKWTANHCDVLDDLDDEIKVEAYLDDETKPTKMLGLIFDANADTSSVNVKKPKNIIYTKRGLLSVCASIYDPLGWLLPVVMKPRMLLQGLWRNGYDWDDETNAEAIEQFDRCLHQIETLRTISIPRWTGEYPDNASEFVGFSDASGAGYGAVLYCRMQVGDTFHISLIAACGHVVPMKGKTGSKATSDEPKEAC